MATEYTQKNQEDQNDDDPEENEEEKSMRELMYVDKEKFNKCRMRMETLYNDNPYSNYIRVRQRYPSIRVRISKNVNGRPSEKNFCVHEYETIEDAVRDAVRYRKRQSRIILKSRSKEIMEFGAPRQILKRYNKPDAQGCLGSLTYRHGSLYYEVHYVKNKKTHAACFKVPIEEMENIESLKKIKREAIQFVQHLDGRQRPFPSSSIIL